MAKDKTSFKAYCDWLSSFEKLSDEEAGQLIKHILLYTNDQNPVPKNRIIEIAFEPIKQTLKRDLKKWEETCNQNRKNVLKRWNKSIPNDTNVNDRIRTNTNYTDRDRDRDRDKKINIPTQEEFICYGLEKKPDVVEDSLRLKYEAWVANDWKDGNDKHIKNWKAKLIHTLPHLRVKKIIKPLSHKQQENEYARSII